MNNTQYYIEQFRKVISASPFHIVNDIPVEVVPSILEQFLSDTITAVEREYLKEIIFDNKQILGALSRYSKDKPDEIEPILNTRFTLKENIRIAQIRLEQLKAKYTLTDKKEKEK